MISNIIITATHKRNYVKLTDKRRMRTNSESPILPSVGIARLRNNAFFSAVLLLLKLYDSYNGSKPKIVVIV